MDNLKTKPSVCFVLVSQTCQVINFLQDRYSFRMNMANHRMEFRLINEEAYHYLSDSDFNSIKVELGKENISCSRETLHTIIFSNVWESYDPYQLWYDSLPIWSGEDHIARLAQTVTTDDQDYWLFCFKKWLVAFVGSLVKEDVVNQEAIIFCGKQGIGKSTWFRNILCEPLREYSSSGFLQPKDKETLIQLSELCLYNMDEVENLKPANVEAIKEIMTKPSMYLRRAYTTLSNNYPRRCSFCGTANGTSILHDTTGNRRFLCQNVTAINFDLESAGIDLNQVYAQAKYLFENNYRHYFSIEDQRIVEEHNMHFRAVSIEEELVTSYLEPCNDQDEGAHRCQAHELRTYLSQRSHGAPISVETLGKVLSANGFKKKKSGVSKWIVRFKHQADDTE